MRLLRRFSPTLVFSALFAAVLASFRNRAALQVEVLALRHQLGVLHRSVKRPKLTAADRLFWAWLSELWSDWRTALVIVRPETVIDWHRKPAVLDLESSTRPLTTGVKASLIFTKTAPNRVARGSAERVRLWATRDLTFMRAFQGANAFFLHRGGFGKCA